jgi:transposase
VPNFLSNAIFILSACTFVPIMFVRTKRTPNSSKTAIQLVETIRTGKRIQQKIVRHFGYAVNDEEIEALKKLALLYKQELEAKTLPKMFSRDNLVGLIESQSSKTIEDDRGLPVNLLDIKEERRICVGIHQCYGRIFDRIGFSKVIGSPVRRKASVQMLRNMVMARIVKPASKRSSVEMLEREYGVALDVNAVYRMMDFLDEDAIKRVKQNSYQYAKSLLDEKVDVIFYDCTTLYFESFIEDDLKQNGYSKDGKFNQSQVLLAIMVTKYGLPIGYELYEGSKFEGHTLDDALNQLHKQYKIDRIIFVADAALLSTENIRRFTERKQPFIVGARIKNLPKSITKKILDKTAYQSLGVQEDGQEEDVTYIDIPMQEDGLRLIVTHSPRRAAKDKHDREKAIEALKKRIEKSSNPTSLLNNFGYKKFLKIEGEGKLLMDELKIAEAEQWDGLHGIVTNLTIEESTAVDLLNHYKGLWQVEETFRIGKYDLRIRPIFHWTANRIKAHVAICYMALCCIRAMEYQVRFQYKKLSPAAIRNELMRLETSILKDYKTGNLYGLPSKASQHAKKIYQIMGLKWNDTPFLLKKKI